MSIGRDYHPLSSRIFGLAEGLYAPQKMEPLEPMTVWESGRTNAWSPFCRQGKERSGSEEIAQGGLSGQRSGPFAFLHVSVVGACASDNVCGWAGPGQVGHKEPPPVYQSMHMPFIKHHL